jgi:hypothetical protein
MSFKHSAINSRNEVVAVHQVPGEGLLHYRRGVAGEASIAFSESRRYNDHGDAPAVALLDTGIVVEVHRERGLAFQLGRLSLADSAEIQWSDAVSLLFDSRAESEYPAVAADGTNVCISYNIGGIGFLYSVAGTIAGS